MKKRNRMAALVCAAVVGVMTVGAPAVSMAEETEAVTEAQTDAEESTETKEAETEAESGEEQTEAALEVKERPEYKASEYVTLGEYKGLTVKVDPIDITDEKVMRQIRVEIGSDKLVDAADGETVAPLDVVNIDYEGKLNGEAFEGGTSKGYDLDIGSGTFIDGFEDGLIGAKVGDTLDLNLTFPENYGSAELAGQETVFTVTVNSIKRLPELTEEFVGEVTDGEYTSGDAYKDHIRTQLQEQAEKSREGQISSDLLTQIASSSKINEYPQELVDYTVGNIRSYYADLAATSGMSFAEFVEQNMYGMTEDEFNEQAVLVAQQNLQAELYLKAIAEAEGIEVSDEAYEAKCEEFARDNGYESVDDLKKAYSEPELRMSALLDTVLDFVKESATVVETSEDETEAETEAETAAEAKDEAETEADTEAGTEDETAAETESETDAE